MNVRVDSTRHDIFAMSLDRSRGVEINRLFVRENDNSAVFDADIDSLCPVRRHHRTAPNEHVEHPVLLSTPFGIFTCSGLAKASRPYSAPLPRAAA
jgi:hypothetical protein